MPNVLLKILDIIMENIGEKDMNFRLLCNLTRTTIQWAVRVLANRTARLDMISFTKHNRITEYTINYIIEHSLICAQALWRTLPALNVTFFLIIFFLSSSQ